MRESRGSLQWNGANMRKDDELTFIDIKALLLEKWLCL